VTTGTRHECDATNCPDCRIVFLFRYDAYAQQAAQEKTGTIAKSVQAANNPPRTMASLCGQPQMLYLGSAGFKQMFA